MRGAEPFDTSFAARDREHRAKHGHTWERGELRRLRDLFREGKTLEEMCVALERPAAGVIPKLSLLRLIFRGPDDRYYRVATFTTIPTEKEDTVNATSNEPIVIENQTLVNGRSIKEMTNNEIFALISRQEEIIERLSTIQHRPKRLSAEIERRQAGLNELIKLLDEQPDSEA